MSAQEAAEYVIDARELTVDDVRSLRKEVNRWRRIYNERYRDIRNKVFAHKELPNLADVEALLAKTEIAELKELFKFLGALESVLWAAFHNGVAPDLGAYDVKRSPGEKVYQQGHAVLTSMLTGSAPAVRY